MVTSVFVLIDVLPIYVFVTSHIATESPLILPEYLPFLQLHIAVFRK